jgi:hypothetical protein
MCSSAARTASPSGSQIGGSECGIQQGRGEDIECLASLFEDDLDDVSNRLDAALLEAAAACVRPEPSAEIIELPERTARTTA